MTHIATPLSHITEYFSLVCLKYFQILNVSNIVTSKRKGKAHTFTCTFEMPSILKCDTFCNNFSQICNIFRFYPKGFQYKWKYFKQYFRILNVTFEIILNVTNIAMPVFDRCYEQYFSHLPLKYCHICYKFKCNKCYDISKIFYPIAHIEHK